MNPPSAITFESLAEQPTVVDGQRRREALTTGVTNTPSALHARCVTCGATASDWRHLLGVGARVVACTAQSRGVLLTYPGACGKCGASRLLVDT